MSIDCRTRRHCDRTDLSRDDVFDRLIPQAASENGDLAARGARYKQLPPLTLVCNERAITLDEHAGELRIAQGPGSDGVTVQLDEDALSDLVQDWSSPMGLAMNSRASIVQGDFQHWLGWEPVLRALCDARPVYESGDITFTDSTGKPLDLYRSFSLDDDRAELSRFLHEAGFLHVRNVFTGAEMTAVATDLDAALAKAKPDDGASWWAGDSHGEQQAVRILFFQEQSAALRALLADQRLTWLANLTGDNLCGHSGGAAGMEAEGLVKPLDIKTGLSDLPWHKDCGQGRHAYYCNGLTVGISVTGADEVSGALGVVAGSHRANIQSSGKQEGLDLPSLKLATRTGDLTVHCSDTLHRAYPPIERPRKVVYTAFRQPLMEGDRPEVVPEAQQRATRAKLTDVQDRIADAAG